MAAATKRTSINLDAETLKEIDELKKSTYYDTSYAVMYRDLVKLGIAQMKKKGHK